MNEDGYRILEIWMLDLMSQQLTDENKAHRILIATRYLAKHYREGWHE